MYQPNNPYVQGGGSPGGPSSLDPYKGIAFVVAFMTTIVVGPIVADWASPIMSELFVRLYGPGVAGFMTGLFEIGIYLLVGFISMAYVYVAVLALASYAGMRLLPVLAA